MWRIENIIFRNNTQHSGEGREDCLLTIIQSLSLMFYEQMFGPGAIRNAGEKIIKCYDWIITYQLHNYTCPNCNGPKKLQPSELIIS